MSPPYDSEDYDSYAYELSLMRELEAEDEAAIRGESIPESLTSSDTISCVVRGIRYHDGFAQELHGQAPQFTRALNARAIMSNRVPEMSDPQDFPYCSWHPDVPNERTLRDLLKRYLDNMLLCYQVGRACAVAGYTDLYHELGLLPEVAIAEEARDSQHGEDIFKSIMAAPVRYAYMDDYNCCLREHPVPNAFLNGDTCVRSTLDKRVALRDFPIHPGLYFNITEDQCVDMEGVAPACRPVDPEAVRLLHSPLPRDLPTVDKDLLILMAAWTGNIDRYARLRRPEMVAGEIPCIVCGIYHHPLFAKWWQSETEVGPCGSIRQAVYARCIMNNDLSWLNHNDPELESYLPEMIWYPQPAFKETYVELARRRPSMAWTAARACMHADYLEAFEQINWEPNMWLWVEAKYHPNGKYLEIIEREAAEAGINCEEQFGAELDDDDAVNWQEQWPMTLLKEEMDDAKGPIKNDQSVTLHRELTLEHVGFENPELASVSSTVGDILLHACVADPSTRPPSPFTTLDLVEVYTLGSSAETEEERKMVGLYPAFLRTEGKRH